MRKAIFSLLGFATLSAAASSPDYTKGVFIVNEDWYGHNNSTLNHLDPDNPDGDYWTYRVIQHENEGMELGATNQFGAIFQGRFYLIAKQAKDPGADITGGRITIADAATMKIIKQIELIDPTGAQCDGRGFVGVDAQKGYVSSSNGVWILDLQQAEITGRVKGTENPFAGGDGDKPVTNPSGALYHGQSGSMTATAGHVFAAHPSKGLLVIDPSQDAVTHTIPIATTLHLAGAWNPDAEQTAKIEAGETTIDEIGPGIGSVVAARDGSLWVSVAEDISGSGVSYPALIHVDPNDLSTEVIELPGDMAGPHSSWYAWTPDAFCSSAVTDCLYWKGGATRWFGGSKLFKFNTSTRKGTLLVDTMDKTQGEWGIYGCSMRVHPSTDEIYVSLYKDFINETYLLRRYSSEGSIIKDYPMISNYWFPSLPVFPESAYNSSVVNITHVGTGRIESIGKNRLKITDMQGAQGAIYDVSGRCVERFTIAENEVIFSPNLPAGIYILRIGNRSVRCIFT